MEEVITYMNENQVLFFIIFGCIILSIILILVSQFLSSRKEKKKEPDTLEKLESLKNEVKEETEEVKTDVPSELDEVLEQMQQDLEKEEEKITEDYEDLQEKTAIISYKELLKASMREIPREEEENEPVIMSVHELEQRRNTDFVALEEDTKKFKNTDFISPIYGKINSNLSYPKISAFKKEEEFKEVEPVLEEKKEVIEPKDSLFVEELRKEMRKKEEFLQALKEFRRNL